MEVRLFDCRITIAKVTSPEGSRVIHAHVSAAQPAISRGILAELDQDNRVTRVEVEHGDSEVYGVLAGSLANLVDAVYQEAGENFLVQAKRDLEPPASPVVPVAGGSTGGYSH